MIHNHPESRIRVRFKDCDPLGHLYNTRFLEYMLEAREDHIMEYYSLNLEDYAIQHGRAWVVAAHQIAYYKEAKRNEYVRIKSAMVYYDEKSIINEYQMWDDNMEHLKALMWTTFLHIDLKLKKVSPHDAKMMEQLKDIHLEIEETDFAKRSLSLRNKKTIEIEKT